MAIPRFPYFFFSAALAALLLPHLFSPVMGFDEAGAKPRKDKRIGKEYIYKKAGDRELKLYVLAPPDGKPGERRPAVVWFHGGAWVKGGPTAFNLQSKYLAERGIVSVQVEYRLAKSGIKEPPTVCVHDARSAMRWVRTHAPELGIDPERMAAGGGSAGGHLAAVCGLIDGLDDPADDLQVSAKPQALVLFCPVLDTGPQTNWGRNLMGERAKEFSPAHSVSASAPPTVIFVGTADKLIPMPMIERFKADMARAGVRCETFLYEGQGHGFFNVNQGGAHYAYETLLEIDRFLASLGWLAGPPTLTRQKFDEIAPAAARAAEKQPPGTAAVDS